MPFTPKNWQDDPSTATPLSAAAVEDVEERVTDYTDAEITTLAGLVIVKSIFDAKGDLLVGTADNTAARLAAGTNGHVLTRDSAEATGLKWAAAGGGTPYVRPETFGAVGDGVTDSTVAIQDAIAAAGDGGTVYFSEGVYLTGALDIVQAVTLEGSGIADTILRPLPSVTGSFIRFRCSLGVSTSQNESHLYGAVVRDLTLDGNGRTIACRGLEARFVDRFRLDRVLIKHFQREAFYVERGIRESVISDLYIRHCGSASYPALRIIDNDPVAATDASNEVFFYGLRIVFPHGHAIHIEKDVTYTSPTRKLFFIGAMLHGHTSTPEADEDGYTFTESVDDHGTHMLLVQDARDVHFIGSTFHLSGRGQALVRLAQGNNGASSVNQVWFTDCHFGGSDYITSTFTAATDDILTFPSAKYISTGAVVRVSSSATLPAGLSAATDYWAIRVTDSTIKLATSRANAVAGTAVDITSTGTGTHTLATRDVAVETEWRDAKVSQHAANVPLDGVTRWENRTGDSSALQVTPSVSLQGAKGDLIVGSGIESLVRRTVGANDLALVADSAESTGVKWAAPVPADLSITLAKAAMALRPSGSAASTDESLRRLGTGATHAAAGDDSRFPASGEKNALAGTAGTPGTGNEYATKQTADADRTAAIAKALVDVKGDLIVATAADTVARQAIGTNGYVLTSDSTLANGLKWAAPDVTQAELDAVAAAKQPIDADLTALAGLISAADKVPYFTGSGTATVATQTTFARTLLDDADAATARATLGVSAFGTWFPVPNRGNNASTAAVAATLYFGQIIVPGDATLTGVALNCVTTLSGSIKALLFDSAGVKLKDGTGTVLPVGITKAPFVSTYAAPPGVYFVALICSAASTLSMSATNGPGNTAATGTYATPPASITVPTGFATVPGMTTY